MPEHPHARPRLRRLLPLLAPAVVVSLALVAAPASAAPTSPIDIPVEPDHQVEVTNVVYDPNDLDVTVSFDYDLVNGASSGEVLVEVYNPDLGAPTTLDSVAVTGSGSYSDTFTFDGSADLSLAISTTTFYDQSLAPYSFVPDLPLVDLTVTQQGKSLTAGEYSVLYDWTYPEPETDGVTLKVYDKDDGFNEVDFQEIDLPADSQYIGSLPPGNYRVAAWYRYSGTTEDPLVTVDFVVTEIPTSVTTSETSVGPGGTLTVTGVGFLPNEDIEIYLHSTPVLLFSGNASGTGTVSQVVTIPANTSSGAHQIRIVGATSGTVATNLTVLSTLPKTGSEGTLLVAGVGAVLLLGGATLFLIRRRAGRRTA